MAWGRNCIREWTKEIVPAPSEFEMVITRRISTGTYGILGFWKLQPCICCNHLLSTNIYLSHPSIECYYNRVQMNCYKVWNGVVAIPLAALSVGKGQTWWCNLNKRWPARRGFECCLCESRRCETRNNFGNMLRNTTMLRKYMSTAGTKAFQKAKALMKQKYLILFSFSLFYNTQFKRNLAIHLTKKQDN